jgi:hypothetical protein
MELVLVKLKARNAEAVKVQEVLTQFGCHIAVRLGLHEVQEQTCSDEGMILLQVKSEPKITKQFVQALKKIPKLEVKQVTF